MAIDGDNDVTLPTPPPPRPAARKAAIDAALRKFDGAEERRPPRAGWASAHRRPIGALATAALVAVLGIPAALIALRDQPPAPVPQNSTPPAAQYEADVGGASSSAVQPEPQDATGTEPRARASRSRVTSLAPADRGDELALAEEEGKAKAEVAPAPAVAAAPPPPPPPPPAPAPDEQFAGATADQAVIVTGSRIPKPNLSKQSDSLAVAERAQKGRPATIDPYGDFLSRLRASVRADDREAIVRLVAFPLRVTLDGRTRMYRSSAAVERDFDEIFTPRVKAAILGQRAELSRTRDELAGNGTIRFGPASPDGPIRIREVNP